MKNLNWISRRIAFDSKKSFSVFIFRIAALAVALSVSVMIITMSVMNGFQKEVSQKVFNFWGHIDITNFDSGLRFDVEATPVNRNNDFLSMLDSLPEVKHVQAYANKAGIIKANNEIEGIILKGMDYDFNPEFMADYLIDGSSMLIDSTTRSNDIIISSSTADRLNLTVDERIEIWFIQDPPRVRKLTIKGFYKTGLEEFDKLFAYADFKNILRLIDW